MKTFTLEFALEKMELRRLIVRQLFTRGITIVLLLLPLVMALLLFGTKDSGGFLVSLVLCYFLIIPLQVWLMTSRAIRQIGPDFRAIRRYTLTSEELSVTTDGATAANRWYLYSGVTETKRFLVIHIRASKRILGIPKRIFQTPEECAELRDSVRSWIAAATAAQ